MGRYGSGFKVDWIRAASKKPNYNKGEGGRALDCWGLIVWWPVETFKFHSRVRGCGARTLQPNHTDGQLLRQLVRALVKHL